MLDKLIADYLKAKAAKAKAEKAEKAAKAAIAEQMGVDLGSLDEDEAATFVCVNEETPKGKLSIAAQSRTTWDSDKLREILTAEQVTEAERVSYFTTLRVTKK